MNILLIGSGGREHALAYKIKQSPHTQKLFVAPGSHGIAEETECVSLDYSDFSSLMSFIRSESIGLVVVGPEAPLVAGLADRLTDEKICVFGPNAKGARLEASKAYTKELLHQKKIPTASYETFSDASLAVQSLASRKYPLVVKADGLAAGKGVIIAKNIEEATEAIRQILIEKSLGSQSKVVLEDFLVGEEASFMGVTDGKTFLPLVTSQDHKRVFDHDEGPNTGGMGAYSPAPVVTAEVYQKTIRQIIHPSLEGLKEQGVDYRGVLYAGLMIDQGQPSLLEYNVRFGDPECQVILPRLKSDFVELMMATVERRLDQYQAEWDPRPCVCVVLTAEGYPGVYRKGDVIEGIEDAALLKDVKVFHAGTAKQDGRWVTQGGRVLGVTALGENLKLAIDLAYEAVGKICWKGMHFRKDIGLKALK